MGDVRNLLAVFIKLNDKFLFGIGLVTYQPWGFVLFKVTEAKLQGRKNDDSGTIESRLFPCAQDGGEQTVNEKTNPVELIVFDEALVLGIAGIEKS